MKFKHSLNEIILELEKIGEVESIGLRNSGSVFTYTIDGPRNTSDFETLNIIKGIQTNFLSDFPIIENMNMDDDILMVQVRKGKDEK